MITPTQASAAKAIVNIFETGTALGDYGMVTLIAGDTGHLTFGRSQTTLGSGNLAKMIDRYCANHGAQFARQLQPFLPRLAAKDLTLDNDGHLHNILRATADDPVMRDTQDAFFDEAYWKPAVAEAERLGISTPLGIAVVYDSRIHGSWGRIRNRTIEKVGELSDVGEKKWVERYTEERRDWLGNSSRADLRATVYRMDALHRLIELDQWGLGLPLVVRGVEITPTALTATPPGSFEGPQPGSRVLALQTPLARGLDVRLVQLGLSGHGVPIKADGIFGRNTADHIRHFQESQGLPATGVADVGLIARLLG